MIQLSKSVWEFPQTYNSFKEVLKVCLTADLHLDNPKTDKKLIKKDYDYCLQNNIPIFIFGDLFCAMQGKLDKRSSKSDLAVEHKGGDYLDRLVNTTIDFLLPYKDVLAFVSPGNHETSIKSRFETDLTKRLVEGLNLRGCNVQLGTYSGYIRFSFRRKDGSGVRSTQLFYHHGYGGDAPVTKGAIQTNRMAVYLPDAEIVVSGHTHNHLILPIPRERVRANGELYTDVQTHIKLSTYKEEYLPHEGWHVERGAPPKPLGGAFLSLRPCEQSGVEHVVNYKIF
jgi:hypothetical protein